MTSEEFLNLLRDDAKTCEQKFNEEREYVLNRIKQFRDDVTSCRYDDTFSIVEEFEGDCKAHRESMELELNDLYHILDYSMKLLDTNTDEYKKIKDLWYSVYVGKRHPLLVEFDV